LTYFDSLVRYDHDLLELVATRNYLTMQNYLFFWEEKIWKTL